MQQRHSCTNHMNNKQENKPFFCSMDSGNELKFCENKLLILMKFNPTGNHMLKRTGIINYLRHLQEIVMEDVIKTFLTVGQLHSFFRSAASE